MYQRAITLLHCEMKWLAGVLKLAYFLLLSRYLSILRPACHMHYGFIGIGSRTALQLVLGSSHGGCKACERRTASLSWSNTKIRKRW